MGSGKRPVVKLLRRSDRFGYCPVGRGGLGHWSVLSAGRATEAELGSAAVAHALIGQVKNFAFARIVIFGKITRCVRPNAWRRFASVEGGNIAYIEQVFSLDVVG